MTANSFYSSRKTAYIDPYGRVYAILGGFRDPATLLYHFALSYGQIVLRDNEIERVVTDDKADLTTIYGRI